MSPKQCLRVEIEATPHQFLKIPQVKHQQPKPKTDHITTLIHTHLEHAVLVKTIAFTDLDALLSSVEDNASHFHQNTTFT
jgi:hypothetical protein